MADVQALLSALDAFNQPSDKVAFERANTWLQDFQHSNEAWAICNVLLLNPESPLSAKIFAAQTFRAKVTYDLHQLDPSFLPSLRDTILSALESLSTGPKTIVIQLSLALSGLALQFPAWQDVAVQNVIDKFGRTPALVPVLLEFLTVLPEEVTGNTKIPVDNDEYRVGANKLLTGNASAVLSLLTMYISATGVTTAVQSQVFQCLRSWVGAGEISAAQVSESPLLSFAFEALESEVLFDAAIEVICNVIHETQELDENMPVIQLVVPKLIQLKPKIAEAKEDSERVRGLAKLFSEAGEIYRLLILQHPETFFPIVEAIGECSAYPDLDVVPITFPFWMRLAQSIGKKPSVSPLLLDAYRSLMAVMIRHLHFPEDPSAMSAQEADDFRAFRHVMGDTLKDCCFVLGAENCLTQVYESLASALAKANASGHSATSWQEIEAPLFSLRSMGAEIDPSDDRVIPRIMDLLPLLPDHPRIRYAAILVISRYSDWTSQHPNYIPFQLQYISTGFDSPDNEVPAAASQAMNYLCLDCKRDMIPFLPQLHSFLASIGAKLIQEDRRRLYEAVAHVISAMPMQQAALSLNTFSADILSKIHEVAVKVTAATKQELQEVSDGLESLESMLAIVDTYGEELPEACSGTCQQAWEIFDPLVSKYGSHYDTAERITRVIRGGLRFFGSLAMPVIPSVLARMSFAFEATGVASYVWIAGKVVQLYGEEDANLGPGVKDAYERSTTKVVTLLQQKELRDIPDVLEDYLQLLLQMIASRPDIFFESSVFPMAVRVAIMSLTLIHSDIIFASLDLLRGIVTHDAMDPSLKQQPPKFSAYAVAIQQMMDSEGPQLVANLLGGLVNDFPEESVSTVITIFRMLAILWPQKLLVWLPQVLDQVSMPASFAPAKTKMLSEITNAINLGHFDKVKHAVIGFHRFSVKARDRRRVTRTFIDP